LNVKKKQRKRILLIF